MDNKLPKLKGLFDFGVFLFFCGDWYSQTEAGKYFRLPWCKNLRGFLCFVSVVRIRVYYLDFFGLHH